MNFKINELSQFNNNIIDFQDVNIHTYITKLFLDNKHTLYVLKDKNWFGAITPVSILNFDTGNAIDENHITLQSKDDLDFVKISNSATAQNVYHIPIFIDDQIKKEFVLIDKPISLFSMDKERWNTLYSKNNKVSDFLKNNFNNIAITGDFSKEIYDYIQTNCKELTCSVIDNSYEEFKNAVAEGKIIIDTNDSLKDLKIKLCNIS